MCSARLRCMTLPLIACNVYKRACANLCAVHVCGVCRCHGSHATFTNAHVPTCVQYTFAVYDVATDHMQRLQARMRQPVCSTRLRCITFHWTTAKTCMCILQLCLKSGKAMQHLFNSSTLCFAPKRLFFLSLSSTTMFVTKQNVCKRTLVSV